jgi:Holliday junction resolvase RusA-like endonuclease
VAVTGTPSTQELDEQLHALFVAFGGVGEPVAVTLPWAPVPKKRPRFAGGRTYQDPADRAAEDKTRSWLALKVRQRWHQNVVVVAAFCRPDRRSLDVDNLLKHLLDSANRTIFYDDSQVTASGALVEYDKANPRTVVLIGEHASSMPREVAEGSARRKKPRAT